ncbi:hypothetical protein CRUP_031334 [Coryphaenoides rupestris]|nr:hypothetical protein CRUP_031334 [Coryphaenoides rupestris]
MVSLTAANTKRMFSVSVAQVHEHLQDELPGRLRVPLGACGGGAAVASDTSACKNNMDARTDTKHPFEYGHVCFLERDIGYCKSPRGVYTFGLFTVDIFVNAGQVVTGNLAPYFLTVCKPNFTALGCKQALRYISHQEACTGNQVDILRARKTFPSKEAALSLYGALYLAMYVTCTVRAKGTRLAKPVLSLTLMCLAFLTGLNRVVCVVHNFKGKLLLSEESPSPSPPPEDHMAGGPVLNMGRVDTSLEKYIASQNHIAFAEVT